MEEPDVTTPAKGTNVFVLSYDEEGNEVRRLPAELSDDDDRTNSRDFGIDTGRWRIERIKHGPLIASEVQLREANVGSLRRAIADNYYGTTLSVDQSEPPIREDIRTVDERYEIDIVDGALVAKITQRYPQQPAQKPAEISAGLARIAAAYACHVHNVNFTFPGGGSPDEWLAPWPDDEKWSEQFRADSLASLATRAHDVNVYLATDEGETMSTLIDGATALADFISATQGGRLDAKGVLNLLRGEHFNALIGENESSYLEVKTAMHPIWVSGTPGEKAKIELAQDVARFANGDVDAVLVIGYREAAKHPSQIGSLTPVADAYLNVAQITEVLDARIVPPLEGIVVETFTVSADQSLLAIFVPRQPAEMQPYLVHGAIAGDKVEGAFFSIVTRRGEASITTSAQQIHAYIVAGKRFLRDQE